jgi:hypothetical protein
MLGCLPVPPRVSCPECVVVGNVQSQIAEMVNDTDMKEISRRKSQLDHHAHGPPLLRGLTRQKSFFHVDKPHGHSEGIWMYLDKLPVVLPTAAIRQFWDFLVAMFVVYFCWKVPFCKQLLAIADARSLCTADWLIGPPQTSASRPSSCPRVAGRDSTRSSRCMR